MLSGGNFTRPTKTLGFYGRDSGLLVGAHGAPFTHSCLLTKLCSAGRVLARDFETAERIFYDGNWKFVVFFFPAWEMLHLPMAFSSPSECLSPKQVGTTPAQLLWELSAWKRRSWGGGWSPPGCSRVTAKGGLSPALSQVCILSSEMLIFIFF